MAMTEINFSRDICPDVRRFQLDADNDKATQVNIPVWARKVTVRVENTSGGRISFFSDGDDIHSDYIKIGGNVLTELTWWDGYKVANGVTKLYVANRPAIAGATFVSVMVEGAK